jgi:hypothetical protein
LKENIKFIKFNLKQKIKLIITINTLIFFIKISYFFKP